MNESLKCLFVSYNQAALETREKVSLSSFEQLELLQFFGEKDIAKEIMILSTCNRTEFYYVSEEDLSDNLVQELCRYKKLQDVAFWKEQFTHLDLAEAVIDRLFRISNGLMSQVLGDFQIIRQVKDAYEMAVQNGTIGAYLHRLLQSVFASHKDISTYTAIHSGNASVSSVASEMIQRTLQTKLDESILLVGAGKFAIEVIEQLQKKGYTRITLINRHDRKSASLAKQYGLVYRPYQSRHDLQGFNVIVTCVSSSESLITQDNWKLVGEKALLIDLSVPRAIDPILGDQSNVTLINMDRISEHNEKAIAQRKEAIPKAEMIMQTYCEDFMDWEKANLARPILNNLKKAIEEIRLSEVNRHLKKWKDGAVDREMVDMLTKNIVNKIIKVPAVRLNETSQKNGSELYRLSKALANLFDLNEVESATT